MMVAEQIDEALRAIRGGARKPGDEVLRALADLSVSVLRMIDYRRERGIAFDDSYNEQVLRRALVSMADQEFPPGPPMTPAPSSVLDEAHDFQRYEHRTRGYTDRPIVRQLKIVCRCGWSADWIDRDPDGDVAVTAARVLLQDHIGDAIARSK